MLLSNIGKKKNDENKKRPGNEAKWRKFFSINNEYLLQCLMDVYRRESKKYYFYNPVFQNNRTDENRVYS